MSIILDTFRNIVIQTQTAWNLFSYIWFIVLPIGFYYLFKVIWMEKVWVEFLNSLDWILLELIPPRDIEKSPKLMEAFYASLAGAYKTIYANEKYMQGVLTLRYSLELVSESGKVHFYVRTTRALRDLVESSLYSQYPDIHIIEVPDYTKCVPRVIPNKNWDIWGADMELQKPDPFPIKTYKYFQEDVTGKMIDPLSAVVEWMGTIKQNQNAWIQIIIIPEPEKWNDLPKTKTPIDLLKGRVKKETKGVFRRATADLVDVFSNIGKGFWGPVEFKSKEEEKEEQPLEFRLSPGEKEVLKAVEENVGKNFYEVKMRFVYLGRKENFDKAGAVSSFFGVYKQFSDLNLNSLKPNDDTKTYSLYVATEPRLKYRQRMIFQRYLDRDPTGVRFHLSTAELATLFHFPDMSVVAPSITRVETRHGGAPSNLPVQ